MTKDATSRPPLSEPQQLSLLTDEALRLVRRLVERLPPVSSWKPTHKFKIVARPSPVAPLVVDCRGLRLHVDLNYGSTPRGFVATIHELFDMLSWLAACPGCEVAGNAPLWQKIVAMLIGTGNEHIEPACLIFGDPENFPRWIIPFTAHFGVARDPSWRARDSQCEDDKRFVEALLAHSSTEEQPQTSPAYAEVIDRIRPLVERQGRDRLPPKVPVGIHLRCDSSCERRQYFEEIRAYLRGLRSIPSARMRFDSLGFTMTDRPVGIETIDELSDLRALVEENHDLCLSRIETQAKPLQEFAGGPDEESVPKVLDARRHFGGILDDVLRNPGAASGQLQCIQTAETSIWQATVVCATLRSSTRPIDHLISIRDYGISLYGLRWLAYGLFHRSSPARVRQLELTMGSEGYEPLQIAQLLASDRPGKILVDDRLPRDHLDEIEYCLLGTRARLKSTSFVFWEGGFRSFENPLIADVSYTEADIQPEFEALATCSEWVGILVPGHGFGWVKRDVVDCIWTQEHVPMKETHSIQEMIIHSPCFKQVAVLLEAVGEPVRSLRVRGAQLRGTMTEEILDRILRACPNLTALDIPSMRLDPLVQAYEEGRCAIRSLVTQSEFGEEANVVARFLAMLRDSNHPGAMKLEKLAFHFRPIPGYGLTSESGRDVVMQMMVRSARLRVFFLVEDCRNKDRLDLGPHGLSKNDWQKTHPLIALKSVSGRVGTVIRRVDPDVWGIVLEFMGPNRTVRVMTSEVEQCYA